MLPIYLVINPFYFFRFLLVNKFDSIPRCLIYDLIY